MDIAYHVLDNVVSRSGVKFEIVWFACRVYIACGLVQIFFNALSMCCDTSDRPILSFKKRLELLVRLDACKAHKSLQI